MSEWVDS